jgi:hypothetical protein
MAGGSFSPNSLSEFWGDQEQPSPSSFNLVLDAPQAGPSGDRPQGQTTDNAGKPIGCDPPQGVDTSDAGADAMEIEAPDVSSNPNTSVGQRTRSKALGRPKYKDLGWNAHKATMRTLYMDKDMSLKDMMEVMEREHSFQAS